MRPVLTLVSLASCTPRYLSPGEVGGNARYDAGSPEAALIVRAANELTLTELDDEVPLNHTAAVNLVAARSGPDEVDGTVDDTPFPSIVEVDAVPGVGEAAMNAMLAYAQDQWAGEVFGYLDGTPDAELILEVANTATHAQLDGPIGLGDLAACDVFEGRVGPDGVAGTADDSPYATLAELAAVPFVDRAAFDALLTWGLDHAGPAECPPGFIVSSDGMTRFTDLTSALLASAPGTVLDLCEGEFYGGWSVTEDVTLRGRGVDLTRLTTQGTRFFTVSAGTSLTLERMSMVSTYTSTVGWGAGLIDATAGDIALTIREAYVAGGEGLDGGALYMNSGTLVVSDSTFEDNRALYGGAMFLSSTDARIERTTFAANQGTSPTATGQGGALYLLGASVELVDSSIEDSEAWDGGGVHVSTASTFTMTRSAVVRNWGAQGGGVHLASTGTLIATSSDFGVGADDNPNGDVYLGGATLYFGDDVSMVCAGTTCQ
ncbi:MAG: right-handed parallel beta-helix repeat-containing protein [Myxococcota bacterium]